MPKVNKIVTYKQLKKLKACNSQLYLFKKLFGDEVLLTKEIVINNSRNFSLDWAIINLLSKRDIIKHNKSLETASKEYSKVLDAAREKYEETKYDKVQEIAIEEYRKAVTAAGEKYNKIRCLSFYNLYKGEEYAREK